MMGVLLFDFGGALTDIPMWAIVWRMVIFTKQFKEMCIMKKRMMSLLLCVILAASMAVVPVQAAGVSYAAEATTLYQLGLFRGTGTNPDGTSIFALEQPATRMQGLIMLIRLLGEEDAALAYTGACPFKDVSGTAARYAAYAKSKGYTAGTTPTAFGNGELSSNAFLTFVLRALGYNDQAGDFSYASACEKAEEIGLVEKSAYRSGEKLLRGDCARISCNALKQRLKGSDLLLTEKLLLDGAVRDQAVNASRVLQEYYLYIDYDAVAGKLYRLPADATEKELKAFLDDRLDRLLHATPVQQLSELEAVASLLDSMPDSTFACDLGAFKAELRKIKAMGGSEAYIDDSNDIDPETFYSSGMVFDRHTNAEARAFVEDYVRNFDPAFLYADSFPEKPADWRDDVEIWYGMDYEESAQHIAVGREHWAENLNILRFAAIIDETPGELRTTIRYWQMGETSDAGLKNQFDRWIAVGGIHKLFRSYVQ